MRRANAVESGGKGKDTRHRAQRASGNRGIMESMSIDVPDMRTLLEFVPTAHYGDTLATPPRMDVPAPFTPASVEPRGGALHISSVLPALSAAIGAPVETTVHHDAGMLQRALGIPQARAAVVVLVDGLGYWNLAMRLAHANYLRALMKEPINQRPISTCAPSTTTAAMATFGTGTCPGLTAMTGYTQRNARTGVMSQLIQFRDAEPPEELQREPTAFELLASRGVRVTSVGLKRFKSSPLTRATLRGAHYLGFDTPLARVRAAAQSAQEPGLTYLYLPDVDKTGHAEGWESEDWVVQFEKIDDQLDTLRRLAPRGTAIVVVADHGMVAADPAERIDIALDPQLTQDVAMVGGEPRSVMLYAGEGCDVAALAERWRTRLAGKAWVRTKDEAVNAGLFGPVSAHTREVLGDVIVQAARNVTLVDSRTQTEGAMSMPGVHGSQTMLEMDVPCIIDMVD